MASQFFFFFEERCRILLLFGHFQPVFDPFGGLKGQRFDPENLLCKAPESQVKESLSKVFVNQNDTTLMWVFRSHINYLTVYCTPRNQRRLGTNQAWMEKTGGNLPTITRHYGTVGTNLIMLAWHSQRFNRWVDKLIEN